MIANGFPTQVDTFFLAKERSLCTVSRKSNDHFVQILEGLKLGEEVDLSPARGGDEAKAQASAG